MPDRSRAPDGVFIGTHALGEGRVSRKQLNSALKPDQWIKLIARLGDIDNPTVSAQPSRFAVKVKPASKSHRGE